MAGTSRRTRLTPRERNLRITHPERYELDLSESKRPLYEPKRSPEKERIHRAKDNARRRASPGAHAERDVWYRIMNNPLMAGHYRILQKKENLAFLDYSVQNVVGKTVGDIRSILGNLFYPSSGISSSEFHSSIRGQAIIDLFNAWKGKIKHPLEQESSRTRMSINEDERGIIRNDKKRFHKVIDSLLFDACMAEIVGNPRKQVYPTQNSGIRSSALLILAALQKASREDKIRSEKMRKVFIRFLRAKSRILGVWATEGLGRLGTKNDFKMLVKLSSNAKNPKLAKSAFDAIRYVGRPEALKLILENYAASEGKEKTHCLDMIRDSAEANVVRGHGQDWAYSMALNWLRQIKSYKKSGIKFSEEKAIIMMAVATQGKFPKGEFRPFELSEFIHQNTIEQLIEHYKLI